MKKQAKTYFWVIVIALVLISIYTAVRPVWAKRQADSQIKAETAKAMAIVDAEYQRYAKGEISYGEAYTEAARKVRAMRYGNNGYFFIDTAEGINVVLYGNKEVENNYRWNDEINGVKYVQELNKTAQAGGGYVNYYYPKQGTTTPSTKRGYAEFYKPFGWVIGTGYYAEDVR